MVTATNGIAPPPSPATFHRSGRTIYSWNIEDIIIFFSVLGIFNSLTRSHGMYMFCYVAYLFERPVSQLFLYKSWKCA